MRTIIDIHILQTVPPSNLNRDDTGSPKTAVYGGVRRARVSSQAWKRATRRLFDELLDRAELGVRTKRVVELVAEEIRRQSPEHKDRADELAAAVLKAAGIELSAPRRPRNADADWVGVPQSGYLLFLSRHQVTELASLVLEAEHAGNGPDKKRARAVADADHGIDVALFGRMVADAADLNVDACAQVAHALSVHAVDNEYDYFTAVDDLAPEDNTGAGMIGTVEFNSSTLYRFATLDVDALQRTLGSAEAAARASDAFVRAFVTSMPSGKQNTFANRTLPDAVVVRASDAQSVNLVGAFEDAVVAGSGTGRLQIAAARLADHANDLDRAYSRTPLASYVLRVGEATEPLSELGTEVSLDDLSTAVSDLVRSRTQELV
jgi:CRISPR system Cascade subunit CasC